MRGYDQIPSPLKFIPAPVSRGPEKLNPIASIAEGTLVQKWKGKALVDSVYWPLQKATSVVDSAEVSGNSTTSPAVVHLVGDYYFIFMYYSSYNNINSCACGVYKLDVDFNMELQGDIKFVHTTKQATYMHAIKMDYEEITNRYKILMFYREESTSDDLFYTTAFCNEKGVISVGTNVIVDASAAPFCRDLIWLDVNRAVLLMYDSVNFLRAITLSFASFASTSGTLGAFTTVSSIASNYGTGMKIKDNIVYIAYAHTNQSYVRGYSISGTSMSAGAEKECGPLYLGGGKIQRISDLEFFIMTFQGQNPQQLYASLYYAKTNGSNSITSIHHVNSKVFNDKYTSDPITYTITELDNNNFLLNNGSSNIDSACSAIVKKGTNNGFTVTDILPVMSKQSIRPSAYNQDNENIYILGDIMNHLKTVNDTRKTVITNTALQYPSIVDSLAPIVIQVDTNKYLSVFRNADNSNYISMVVTTISNGLASNGSVVAIGLSTSGDYQIVKDAPNRAIIAFVDGSNSSYQTVGVINIVDTTPTITGLTVIDNTGICNSSRIQKSKDDVFLVTYFESTILNALQGVVLSLSGDIITPTAPVTVKNAGTTSMLSHTLVTLGPDQFLLQYSHSTFGLTFRTVTLTGTTITANAETTIVDITSVAYQKIMGINNEAGKFIFSYYDTTRVALRYAAVSISGDSVTVDTFKLFDKTITEAASKIEYIGDDVYCVFMLVNAPTYDYVLVTLYWDNLANSFSVGRTVRPGIPARQGSYRDIFKSDIPGELIIMFAGNPIDGTATYGLHLGLLEISENLRSVVDDQKFIDTGYSKTTNAAYCVYESF